MTAGQFAGLMSPAIVRRDDSKKMKMMLFPLFLVGQAMEADSMMCLHGALR